VHVTQQRLLDFFIDVSPGNNLLCKKQGKAAYNTPNGGTPSRTLRMRDL